MENQTNFDIKYIFNDNIERVWSFMREPQFLFKSNKGAFVDFSLIEGTDYWSLNSTFKLIRSTGITMIFTCIESESESFNKSLAFHCTAGDSTSFKIRYTLYQVSSDNTTIVIIEFFDYQSTIAEHFDILYQVSKLTFDKLENYMQKSVLSLFQNEGAIINLNIKRLWDSLLQWDNAKKLTVVHVDAIIFLNQDNNVIQPGTTFKLIFLKENEAYFRIKSMNQTSGGKKYEFIIQYLSRSLFNFKEIRIYLISINENSTQISVCHHFSHPETPDRIKQMSVIKRRILTKMKNNAESSQKNNI